MKIPPSIDWSRSDLVTITPQVNMPQGNSLWIQGLRMTCIIFCNDKTGIQWYAILYVLYKNLSFTKLFYKIQDHYNSVICVLLYL